MIDILCDLPPSPPESCCDVPPAQPAAPVIPNNAPGQSHIAYRIGTFASFRRAMLSDLAELLPEWRPTASGPDYGTVLVELWAYVADVLTFYQEQLANEAFLGTATQRESLVRLAQLVDYRPAPGAAATGLVALGVAKGKVVQVPVGIQVASRPSAGKAAAKFETEVAIVARGEHSQIPLARMGIANQFAALTDLTATSSDPTLLSGNQKQFELFRRVFRDFEVGLSSSVFDESLQLPSGVGTLPSGTATRTVWFAGLGLKIIPGDHLLIFDVDGPAGQKPSGSGLLRQVVDVGEDRPTRRTAITVVEDPAYAYLHPDPVVYAMRIKATPFGANAPLWATLSPYLRFDKVNGYANPDPPFPTNWDDKNAPATLPGATYVWLDRTYRGIATASAEELSWAVLVDGTTYQTASVTGVSDAGHSDFTLTASAPRVDLDENVASGTFSLRGTLILAKSERLELDDLRPLPEQLTGTDLILQGTYGNLVPGQRVIVSGQSYDPSRKAASGRAAAEEGLLDHADATTYQGLTVATLRTPLTAKFGYARSATSLLANVTPVSHGQTVKQEILGNGNGTPWQQFALRKQPPTHLQSAGGQSAVRSTLAVNVNGVLWYEVRDLTDATAGGRVFTVRQDDANRPTVEMGDGVTGAAPPTGRDNVKASYRFGQGTSGNVGAGDISQLVGGLPGLQSVTNPEPTTGGTDRESPDRIRINAPGSIRTFGRAVSADDYTALALTYPGVSRAKASWVTIDPRAACQRESVITRAGYVRSSMLAETSTSFSISWIGRLPLLTSQRQSTSKPTAAAKPRWRRPWPQ